MQWLCQRVGKPGYLQLAGDRVATDESHGRSQYQHFNCQP